ncbi:MAG: ATP-grasp domain-containing protein [Minisyncoccia bacterium]
MRILILYNLAKIVKKGITNDLVCEKEIEIIVPLIVDSLLARGHQVKTLETDRNVWEKLKKLKPEIDIVLNLAEGFGGCNINETFVPALLEALEIPFTGASSRNMMFTMDKEKTNLVLGAYNIPTPCRKLFRQGQSKFIELGLNFPVIVKPVREEASIGITYDSVVSNHKDLVDKVDRVFKLYQQSALVEEFIEGREISVGIIGNGTNVHVFPPLEFIFEDSIPVLKRIRSYEYKWDGGKEAMTKAKLPDDLITKLQEYTKVAYLVTDCRDYARMDYRLTDKNEIFLLEVNYNPGIGPNTHGLNNTLTMMASFEGHSFEDLIEWIIFTAKERYVS